MMRARIFFIKFFYSEHWPTYLFYIPLIPYFLYKAIIARSLTFFLTVNPAIKYSGMGTESKFETLKLLPKEYIPKTVLISPNTQLNTVLKLLASSGVEFPLIAKPDVGFRGFLVKKVESEDALEMYLKNKSFPIILQEFATHPEECGLFYYKIPGQEKGKITSVTLKKFVSVTGNGKHTLAELIAKDKRAFLYYKLFENLHKSTFNEIPVKGKLIKLTVIGNHSKGTQFVNGNHLIDDELVQMLDKVTNDLTGFNYGRFDIKFKTWESLKKRENFKILELNGVIAEPTHIYDSDKSNYFTSLKTILKHWRIINKIARKNHNHFKIPQYALLPFLKEMFWLRKHSRQLKQETK